MKPLDEIDAELQILPQGPQKRTLTKTPLPKGPWDPQKPALGARFLHFGNQAMDLIPRCKSSCARDFHTDNYRAPQCIGVGFFLFFFFGRVTSTLFICKGALNLECTAFPSHAKLAFPPSQGQALWVFSQSLCSQRLKTEQPRKSSGKWWQRGIRDLIPALTAARGTSQSLGELAGPAAPTLQAHPYTQLQAHPFPPSTLHPSVPCHPYKGLLWGPQILGRTGASL